ncbi:hypothetical protein AB0M37_04270 [Micromonospora chalcea]
MAAGLEKVEINTAAYDRSIVYCGAAWEYEEASSTTYSRWQTELTRLLYIYAALEEIVRGFRSDLPEGSPALPAALGIIRHEARTPLFHFERVLAHLKQHVDDSFLSRNMKVVNAFKSKAGEPPGATALRVGVQFRHLFAHGALIPPEPDDSDIVWRSGGFAETCMARGAASCLLMALQVMLAGKVDRSPSLDNEDVEIEEGLWLPTRPFGNEWVYRLPARDYLLALHLTEADDPVPLIPGQLRLGEEA